jgi:NAD(P) transhydrogenase subunit alpha
MSQPSPEPAVTVGVLKETMPGEQRVAVVPESVLALARAGVRVLVEPGAGVSAWFPDGAYERAGAKVAGRDEVIGGADVLVGVGAPAPELIARLRSGQALIGLLRPLAEPELAGQLARAGVTAISLDGLPRTVSRAQSMDALTSQANVAGYKAVLVAADHFGRFFPMLITAAGTSRPANVLVLGAGVAGLQAMGTARRLGAVVTGYDIRPETREQIESVGARFLRLASVAPAEGEGGYARAVTAGEQAASRPSWPRRSPASTSSSPPRRCRAGARRYWSPPRRSKVCRRAACSSTWPRAASAATSRARWQIRRC